MPNLKTIDQMETNKSKYRNKRVIFLVRDPRDVLVSYYYWYTLSGAKELAGDSEFDGRISDFIHHRIGGLDNINHFYSIWAANMTVPREFLLVRYEDITADPSSELKRVLGFIGGPPIAEQVIADVVEFARFENMRELELKGVPGLSLQKGITPGLEEGYLTRKGKVGGYVEYFSDEEIKDIDRTIQAELSDELLWYKYATLAAVNTQEF